ncbi:hypothetical protein GH810_14340 [Acetobacterium paludosum]|uniref:Uncharacterized protein n=1 Tax=Acetobacterium paludosum TaxID=52693 RepID=A0A923KYC3_9FIRM|nr:hypothetical protein [Acetobacterium paludosum]MBC3889491.1 hypothetical protein [Acetobacterium paludosum]
MIKIDMEMPESCFTCRFSIFNGFPHTLASGFYNWGCLAMDNENFLIRFSEFDPREQQNARYKACPLIEVKEKPCHNCEHKNSKNDINCRLCGTGEEDSEWEAEDGAD